MILIQNQHEIKIITKKKSVKTKQILSISLTVLAALFLFIKVKAIRTSTKRQINVYASETRVLKNDYDQNIRTKHKSLTKKTYFFESIRQHDEILEFFVSESNSLIKNETKFIFMTNMNQTQAKICEKQLIERLKHFEISNLSTSATINFEYANVFMKKYEKLKKSNNSFIIKSELDKFENSNINDH